ncbi:MAG: hypothetical protein FJ108_04140 [Deltaproteobacteria bacterium]|nr:hypothetical protein [Deltaproteobacteria bacterium]
MHGGALGTLVLKRADLEGPGITVLNLGGFANPDVLLVQRGGPAQIVKDWGRRSAWVRAFVAPWLARHEAAMLARADGIEGVPRLLGRIDRLALAMEYLDGQPLRRHAHGRALPTSFFAALESILDGLARRGVVYLDLRSPTNVLVTPSGAPALVDLGSAIALPLPRGWILGLERSALAKLRARFERCGDSAAAAAGSDDDLSASLKAGGTRFGIREHGSPGDPTPVLFLPDIGTSARVFAPILARAEALGRRAIGVDLPGFGRSRREVRTLEPSHVAVQIAELLTSLRITRVDLVAAGFAALVADALATRSPALVRHVVAIDADDAPARDAELALRRRLATSDPEALRARLIGALPGGLPETLRAALEGELRRAPARSLALAYPARAHRATPIGVGTPGRVHLDGAAALDPDRIWAALSGPEAR